MPAITDLTWQQLESALGSLGVVSISGGTIVIKPAVLTGDTMDSLTSSGVIEFMHKLREACSAAQSTVNNGQAVGERLAAFPASTATSPSNGYVTVTQQIITRVPLNPNAIVGSTQ